MFKKVVKKYYQQHYGSLEMFDRAMNFVDTGIISPVNPECFGIDSDQVCSRHIHTVPLIWNPYTYDRSRNEDIDRLDYYLADISVFIHDMQDVGIKDLTFYDFSVYMYIIWYICKNKIISKSAMIQFVRSLMIKADKVSNVSLVFHDFYGLYYHILQWNLREHKRRFTRDPIYVHCDKKSVEGFYRMLCNVFMSVHSVKHGFKYPKVTLLNSKVDFVNGSIIEAYLQCYPDDFMLQLNLFELLRKGDTYPIISFIDKFRPHGFYSPLMKLLGTRRITNKKQPYHLNKTLEDIFKKYLFEDQVLDVQTYDPFLDNIYQEPAYSEVIIDYYKFIQYNKGKRISELRSQFKEVCMTAQTFNLARKEYVKTENSEFLPVRVIIKNVDHTEEDAIKFIVSEVNNTLEEETGEILLYELANYSTIANKFQIHTTRQEVKKEFLQ